MGREAVCIARWNGKTAEVRVLLEPAELILRGAIRARIRRAAITGITLSGDVLSLRADGETLELDLGIKAESWRSALTKAPPSLAQKLGVSAEVRAYVIGTLSDSTLAAALTGAQASTAAEAAMLLGELHNQADLVRALTQAQSHPDLPIWCVCGKGKTLALSDATIRRDLRAAGYIDAKSCAVSDRLTATRYGMRK